MSIVAYTGLQGSGKSYEVVSEVVLPAVRKGRRIVTNLDGLNAEAIKAYCLEKWREVVEPQIVFATGDEVKAESFFYWEEKAKDGTRTKAEGTVCMPGDLVIIDEAWDHFGKATKGLSPRVQSFMRMHRHYASEETGIVSDVVFITQHIADLHPDIRNVVERTFRMRKLKELGLETGYTVFQHEGASQRQATVLQKWVKRYDKRIFPLYQSYSAGAGAEHAVDRRQSFFGSSKILWRAGVLLCVLCGGLFGLYRFFKGPPDVEAAASADKSKGKGRADAKSSAAVEAPAKASPVDVGAGFGSPLSGTSGEWQQVGYLIRGADLLVVVRSGDGRHRYLRAPDHVMAGRDLTVMVDGKPVTTWSGSPRGVLAGSSGGRK